MQINYRVPKGSSGPAVAGILSLLAAAALLWTKLYVLLDGWFSPGYVGAEEFVTLLCAALFALFGLSLLLIGRKVPAISAVLAVPASVLVALYAPKTIELGYILLSGNITIDIAYFAKTWIVLWALPLAVIGALMAYCVVCFRMAAGPAMPIVVSVLNLLVWGAYSYFDAGFEYKASFDFAELLNICILPYVGIGLFFLSMLIMLCSFRKNAAEREKRQEQKAIENATLYQPKNVPDVVPQMPVAQIEAYPSAMYQPTTPMSTATTEYPADAVLQQYAPTSSTSSEAMLQSFSDQTSESQAFSGSSPVQSEVAASTDSVAPTAEFTDGER